MKSSQGCVKKGQGIDDVIQSLTPVVDTFRKTTCNSPKCTRLFQQYEKMLLPHITNEREYDDYLESGGAFPEEYARDIFSTNDIFKPTFINVFLQSTLTYEDVFLYPGVTGIVITHLIQNS